MRDFSVLNPVCSLFRHCSTSGAILFRIIGSYSFYVWHKREIGLKFFGIAESFSGLSMAIILDCLHILWILFPVHTLSIVCNHLLAFGPRCFSCSTSPPSLPAALLFFSADIPFLCSSSLKGYAIVGVLS